MKEKMIYDLDDMRKLIADVHPATNYSYDGAIIYEMEDLDEIIGEILPFDLLSKTRDYFNVWDDYFIYDSLKHLKSYSHYEAEILLNDVFIDDVIRDAFSLGFNVYDYNVLMQYNNSLKVAYLRDSVKDMTAVITVKRGMYEDEEIDVLINDGFVYGLSTYSDIDLDEIIEMFYSVDLEDLSVHFGRYGYNEIVKIDDMFYLVDLDFNGDYVKWDEEI